MLVFIEKVTQARSAEEVWGLLAAKMDGFGFDRLIYGYTRFHTKNSVGDMQDILLMTTHGAEYMREFIGNGLYANAPMVQWARENVGVCSWGWMDEHAGHFSPSERKVFEFNKKMGVTAGYSISFRETSSRSKGALGLTAKPGVAQAEVDRMWKRSGREITAMCQVAHLAIMALPQVTARRPLTKRQREALQWVGDGKTTQDIAVLMNLTPATVEKHLRLARETLDAETTAQAVLKAAYVNQIYVVGE